MAKTLMFEVEGRKYTLEFTRDSVKTMERWGFDITKLDSASATQIPMLFRGAFLANHKHMSTKNIDDMYEMFGADKSEILSKLIEMYQEPIAELFGTNEGADKAKKLKWESSF